MKKNSAKTLPEWYDLHGLNEWGSPYNCTNDLRMTNGTLEQKWECHQSATEIDYKWVPIRPFFPNE